MVVSVGIGGDIPPVLVGVVFIERKLPVGVGRPALVDDDRVEILQPFDAVVNAVRPLPAGLHRKPVIPQLLNGLRLRTVCDDAHAAGMPLDHAFRGLAVLQAGFVDFVQKVKRPVLLVKVHFDPRKRVDGEAEVEPKVQMVESRDLVF